jgi:hypothetical protein
MRARLEAQRAYFAGDDHIRDRAAVWRDASPAECLAAVIDQCREVEYFLSLKPPAELDRVLEPEPIPSATLQILEDLQRR